MLFSGAEEHMSDGVVSVGKFTGFVALILDNGALSDV